MQTSNNVKMPWVNILSSWSGWLIDGFISLTYLLTIVSIPAIRGIFFPNNAFLGLGFLFSTLGFALAGGISRFLGSAIMGNYIGDKIGRRTMLIISVPIFSFANFLIFFVPGFDSIGYFSAILIYLISFIVGFFAGAEYGGGTALSLESVPAEKRLWVGAFVQSGFGMGFVLIALVSFFLSSDMGSYYYTYGFRYLFLISIIPGLISLIFRYFSTETRVFAEVLEKQETDKVPIVSMLSSKGLQSVSEFLILVIIIGGLLTVNSVTFGYYFIVLLNANFAAGFAKFDFIYIMIINVVSLAGVFFGAFISTRLILRKKSMVILSLAFLIISIPIEMIASNSSPYVTVTAHSIQACFEAAIFAVIPIFLAEKFSKKFRTTGIGVVYNLGGTIGAFGLSFIAIADVLFSNYFTVAWMYITIFATIVLVLGTLLTSETLTEIDLEKKTISDPITR